jgi:hypothetical protein
MNYSLEYRENRVLEVNVLATNILEHQRRLFGLPDYLMDTLPGTSEMGFKWVIPLGLSPHSRFAPSQARLV